MKDAPKTPLWNYRPPRELPSARLPSKWRWSSGGDGNGWKETTLVWEHSFSPRLVFKGIWCPSINLYGGIIHPPLHMMKWWTASCANQLLVTACNSDGMAGNTLHNTIESQQANGYNLQGCQTNTIRVHWLWRHPCTWGYRPVLAKGGR